MAKRLRVLITGAARGIGMATAQVLAKRGHSVIATDISALSGLEGIQAHVLDATSDDESAGGDFGGVLAEFLNVHMSELRKGGKYTITGQPQVDDFSACCVPNRITPQWQSSARSARTSPGI